MYYVLLRNGQTRRMESHPVGVYFVSPYVGLTFRLLVMCLHAQHAPARAMIITTEGRRGLIRLHFALVKVLMATAERSNPEITVCLG